MRRDDSSGRKNPSGGALKKRLYHEGREEHEGKKGFVNILLRALRVLRGSNLLDWFKSSRLRVAGKARAGFFVVQFFSSFGLPTEPARGSICDCMGGKSEPKDRGFSW